MAIVIKKIQRPLQSPPLKNVADLTPRQLQNLADVGLGPEPVPALLPSVDGGRQVGSRVKIRCPYTWVKHFQDGDTGTIIEDYGLTAGVKIDPRGRLYKIKLDNLKAKPVTVAEWMLESL